MFENTAPRLQTRADLLALVRPLLAGPAADEIIVVLLPRWGGRRVIVTVTGTVDPASVVVVADTLAASAARAARFRALVLVAVRPCGGVEPADGGRWVEAAAVVAEHGLTLLDWVVIGASGVAAAVSVREAAGWPPAWEAA
jgi:hypothetical protein